MGKFGSKNQNCQFKLKFGTQINLNMQNSMVHAEFNGAVDFFSFGPETPFLGKFGPKNQNCQFNVKFGTLTNSSMHNSMVVFNFSVLDWKHCGQIWFKKSKLSV